jgi:nucleoside-diphosphate-sugar epimerase
MDVLFIGGTGNISAASSRLAVARGMRLTLLNRGRHGMDIPGAERVCADIHDEAATAAVLGGRTFDAVVDWIAYDVADIERDIRLFAGRTGQYIFISSASAYQKPPPHPVITESTPLANPYWEYSRKKIACEERLLCEFRKVGFPATVVRPSHTYQYLVPTAFGSWNDMAIITRMRTGKPVVVHGDGTSLWVLTHSEDFARGLVGLIGHPQALGEAFHITSDEVLTWNQIYAELAAAAGVRPNIVHVSSDAIIAAAQRFGYQRDLAGSLLGDKANSVLFDNRKIKAHVPGFQAEIPFRDGICQTLAWFEADPGRQKPDPLNDQFLDVLLSAHSAMDESA